MRLGEGMPLLGQCLFLLCLGRFAEVENRSTDSKPADFDRLYTGNVNRNTEEIYSFNYTSKPGKVDALRVFVSSNSDDLQFPVLFVVRQQKGVLSWQVPLIFRGYYQRTYTYQDVNRTLCPLESEGEAGPLEQFIYIDVASMAPFSVQYQLMVTRLRNFEIE
ncbi:hypothetical protein FKM82_024805 [Ascaphus truei]